MVYVPIKNQYINAYKFTGEVTDELKELRINSIPKSVIIRCNCGKPIERHAVIEGRIICPDSYIVYEGDQIINIMNGSTFEGLYKPAYDMSKVTDVEYTNYYDSEEEKESASKKDGEEEN